MRGVRSWLQLSLLASLGLILQGCGQSAIIAGILLSQNKKRGGGVVVVTATSADLLILPGSGQQGAGVNVPSTEGKGVELVGGQFRLQATTATTVDQIVIGATGSGDDAQIATVKLFEDLDGDGIVGASEPQIGQTSSFNGDEGQAIFAGLSLALAAQQSRTFLITFETPSGASEGDTFQLGITSASDVVGSTVQNGQTKQVPVFGAPFLGGLKTVSNTGSLLLLVGPASPASAAVLPNAQDRGILQIDLRASSSEAIRAESLVLQTSGSGNDAVDLTRADLYLDVDSDGALNASIDAPIVLNQVPSADNGTLTFSGLAQTLAPGSVTRWLVVYDLAGSASNGATFRVDLNAGGLALTGLTSNQAITPTGTPLTGGATLTVTRAELTGTPRTLGNTAQVPGAVSVPALWFDVTAGTAEPLLVTGLRITPSGSGDDASDLSGARLIFDQNGDGLVGAGEPVIAGPATFPANDTALTFSGFARTLAPGTTESWLVALDLSGGSTGGDQFTISVSGGADFTASGQTSSLPVVATSPALTGNQITTRGSLSLQAGPNHSPLSKPTPFANDADVAQAQLRLTTGAGESVRLSSVRVTPSGSGDDQADLVGVDLYHDQDGNGQVNGVEPLLATGVFPADDTALALSAPNLITVPASSSVDLVVRYRYNGVASQGDTFQAAVGTLDLTATGVSSGQAIPLGGGNVSGDTATLRRGTLSASPGPAAPGAGTVLSTQTGVAVSQVRLAAVVAEDVRVSSVRFTAAASANPVNPQTGITQARLYRDDNSDGAVDGGDLLLGTQTFGAGGDVTFGVAAGNLDVTSGTGRDLLLVVDFGGSAADTQTLAVTCDQVVASGQTTSLSATTQSLPQASATKTLVGVGTLALATGVQNPAAQTGYTGQTKVVQQVALSAAGEASRVDSWTVRGTGSGPDDTGVTTVRLHLDNNGDGLLDVGDTLITSGTFPGDPGVLVLNGPNLFTVSAGATVNVIVSYELSGTVVAGQTYGALALTPGDLGVVGGTTGGAITPSGSGNAGGLLTVGAVGTLVTATGPANPSGPTTAFGGQSHAVQQISVTAANEPVRLDSITLRGTGTGADDTGIQTVSLYIDSNANGVLDADTLLTTGSYPADPGVLTLAPGGGLTVVNPGPAVQLLVVYTYAAGATPGTTFGVTSLNAAADLSATGTLSGSSVTPSGNPAAGVLQTIGSAGTLTLALGPAAPLAGAQVNGLESRAVQQLRLTATIEDVRLTSLTLRGLASGTGTDSSGVAEVSLYRDLNSNGVLDGDALVASGTFAGDPGTLALAPTGGLLVISPGTPQTLIVVYRFSTAPSFGESFGLAALAPADLAATGVSSQTAITPSGSAAAGNLYTYRSAVSASGSSLGASPTSVTADGASTTTLTITLRDGQGNPLAGRSVSLSATGTGNTLTQPAGVTNGAGQITGTLASTVAEAKTITATAEPGTGNVALTQQASVTFVPGPPVAGSTLVASPTSGILNNGTTVSTITATVVDAQGNAIQGATVVLSSTGTGNTITQPGLTDALGRASGTIASTVAETKTISATAGGVALSATPTVTFVNGSGSGASAGNSTVAVAPASVVADGATTSTITITVRDGGGSPLAGVPVSLVATGTGNTLTQPGAVTNGAGQTTGTIASTVAEAKTITAIANPGAGQVVISQQPVVTFTPGAISAAQSLVSVSPTSVTADGVATSTITITLRDANQNPIAGEAATFTASGAGNTLTQPGAVTNAQGVTTGTIASTGAGAKTITVTATTGSVVLAQTPSVTFTPGAVSAANSAIGAAPASVAVGGATSTVTVTVRDANNNPIQGATVVLSASGTGNTLTQPAGVTDAAGQATGTIASTVAEAKTISATADAGGGPVLISPTTTVTFTPGAISAAQSLVSVSPTSVTADGVATSTVTITLRDANQNPIAGEAATFTASGAGNTLTQPGAVTNAQGVTTGTIASTGAGAKTITVTATTGSVVLAQTPSVTFTPGAVSATASLIGATSPIQAGGPTSTLTVTIRDANNNPIPGATVVFSASGTGNTITQPGAVTDAAGQATGTLSSTVAEAKTISATADAGAGPVLLSSTAPLNVTPGPINAGTSSATLSPSSAVADGVATSTLTITLRDANNNPIAGEAATFTSTGTGNTLTQPGAVTNAQGVTTGTIASTVAESKTITVTATTGPVVLGTTPSVTFTTPPAGGVSTGLSTVGAAPTSIPADGATTSTITVTVVDGTGTPISGATVQLIATGTGNTITQPAAVTNGAGQATGTIASTVSQSQTVRATADAGAGPVLISSGASLDVNPGAISAGNSLVSVSPASVTANGGNTSTVRITLRDANGNGIPGEAVTFTATGSGNTLTQPVGVTDGNGRISGTIASTVAEAKTITVTATTGSVVLTPTPVVTIVAGPVSAANTLVSAAPASIQAGGPTSTITVTARDANNNPIAGATVALSATGSGNTLTQPGAVTNAAGQTTGTIASTVAEAKTVSATVNAGGGPVLSSNTAAVTVTPGAISAAQSLVSVAPSSLAADGVASAVVTITLRDANQNPIAGEAVTFTASGAGNTLTQPGAVTNAQGVTTGSLVSTGVGSKTITATATTGSVVLNQTPSVTFVAGSVSSGNSALAAAPASVPADGTSSTITVTVRDAGNNPIQGATVVLAATGTGNTLTQPAAVTDAAGQATGTLSSTVAAIKTITATADAGAGPVLISATTTVTVTPGAVSAGNSSISASPTSGIAADGAATSRITVTVRDANNNLIPGATVVLSSTGSNNTLVQGPVTDVAGVTSGTIATTTAETKTVSATANGTLLSSNVSVDFVPIGTLVISTGANNPSDATVYSGETVVVHQARLTATLEKVNVSSYSVTTGGAPLAPAGSVTTAALYQDMDSNGLLGPGDVLLDTSSVATNPGTITFSQSLLIGVSPGSPVDVIVVFSFDASAAKDDTWTVQAVTGATALAATGATSGGTVTASGTAAAGGTMTFGGEPAITVTSQALAAASPRPDDTDVPMLALRLDETTGEDGVRLEALTVTATNAGITTDGDESTDVIRVELWHDANSSGTVDGGDTQLGASVFFVNDGSAAFAGLSQAIPANPGATVDLLVTFDMAGSSQVHVPASEQYRLSVAAGGLTLSAGTSGRSVTPTGLPATGPIRTTSPSANPAVVVSQQVVVPDGSVSQSDANVPMLQLRLTETSGNGSVDLSSISIVGSGSGNELSLTNLKLYVDGGVLGAVGAGDTQIGQTIFFADNGGATFGSLTQTVPSGGTLDLLVAYDYPSAGLTGGTTFQTVVQTGGLSLATTVGGISVVPGGLPQQGGVKTVGGSGIFVSTPDTQTLANNNTVVDIAVADLDLDGDLDYVVLLEPTSGNAQFEVRLGDGTGNFVTKGLYPPSAEGSTPRRIKIGDVNCDGYPDVLIVMETRLTLLHNTGASDPGAFPAATSPRNENGSVVTDAALIDWDRDGDLDVVAVDAEAANEKILVRRANLGNFQSGGANNFSVALPSAPRNVRKVDQDLDGIDDLVVQLAGGGLVVMQGDGSTFAQSDTQATAAGAGGMAVGDVDRDGAPDALIVNDPNLTLFQGDGAGTAGYSTGGGPYATNAGFSTSGPEDMVLGDWNGDGFVDLAITHDGGGVVTRLGDGSFNFNGGTGFFASGINPDRIAVGDFTGDGDPDLLLAATTVSGTVYLLKGDTLTGGGSATFSTPATAATLTTTPTDIEYGDFNRDGIMDFVLASTNGTDMFLHTYLGNGSGGFTVQPQNGIAGGGATGEIAVADMNRDGIPDVVLTAPGIAIDVVATFQGNGSGGWVLNSSATALANAGAQAIALGDLDCDGDVDAVVVETTTNTLQVYFHNGTALQNAIAGGSYATGATIVDIQLVDIDRDGDLDPVFVADGDDRIQWFLNDGSGGFGTISQLNLNASLTDPDALVVADLSGDGIPDVAVSDGSSALIEIFRGTGSGFVTSGTVFAAIGNDITASDVDKDGDLDLILAATPGVATLENTGSLSFNVLTVAPTTGARPTRVLVFDFDREGDVDAVTATQSTTRIEFYKDQ